MNKMKHLHLFGVLLSIIAIGCFLADGVQGNEPVWVAFNCILIGVNFGLWRAK